jgi:hypothetical protein
MCTMLTITKSLAAMFMVSGVGTIAGQTIDFGALQARLEAAIFGLNAAALQDPSTYQSHALQRTSQQVGVDSFSDDKLVQYYTLYCIYYATYAVPNTITDADPQFEGMAFPSWSSSTNWDQINVDPCNGWHGIECDSDGRVMNINLFENFLTGIWPAEVKLLAVDGPFATGAGNLIQIDLFRNKFLSNGGDSSWMSDLGSSISKCISENAYYITYVSCIYCTFQMFSLRLFLIVSLLVPQVPSCWKKRDSAATFHRCQLQLSISMLPIQATREGSLTQTLHRV